MKDKVSIIVPIYNVEEYLPQCLESITQQTYKNLDIILVDDASTDNSLQIALEYANKDKRILVIEKANGMQGSARNLGLEFINGTSLRECILGNKSTIISYIIPNTLSKETKTYTKQDLSKYFQVISKNHIKTNLADINSIITQELPETYIHFVDSDDYLEFDCIEKCIYFIKSKSNIEILAHNFREYIHNSKIFKSESVFNLFAKNKNNYYDSGFNMLQENKRDIFYFSWQGLFNAKILNRYNLRHTLNIFHEDEEFGTLLFALANGVFYADFQGYVYRIRDNSSQTSAQNIQMPSNLPTILKPLKNYFTSHKNLRRYFTAYSMCITAINICSFYKSIHKEKHFLYKKLIKNHILSYILYYYTYDIYKAIPEIHNKIGIKFPKLVYLYMKFRHYLRHPKHIFLKQQKNFP
ncbi:hypothetical protein B6S12_01845 [Helicobacter valdiviensis]|uniref:Glycosyltransferase 2-like domain-containing protein n=1 Tax=Helicobacter valdiviensis TaxID=1458358 RepID=A0A2W6NMZ6_9HELI|nr:glycosyltransferase family A protein [Helicobacter valdiviensis]PZT48816.1 hypothetical protein B6S12_01845 [Helicobacter valdiviensis]